MHYYFNNKWHHAVVYNKNTCSATELQSLYLEPEEVCQNIFLLFPYILIFHARMWLFYSDVAFGWIHSAHTHTHKPDKDMVNDY